MSSIRSSSDRASALTGGMAVLIPWCDQLSSKTFWALTCGYIEKTTQNGRLSAILSPGLKGAPDPTMGSQNQLFEVMIT